jgi:outer membrane immunogenic protein
MKSILLTAVAASFFACSAGAFAADLTMPFKAPPPPAAAPVSDWTGFYIGANGGWGWSSFDPVISPVGAASIADFPTTSFTTSTNGAIFGGQVGYNWQAGSWLLGVEGDIDGAGISGTQTVLFPSGLNHNAIDGFTETDKIEGLASIRGRIGYVWGPGLLYFTGGGAWERVVHNTMVSTDTTAGTFANSASGSFSATRSGFVIGGGYEWMVAQHWTVRAEYLYYDFTQTDSTAFTFPTCAGGGSCGANAAVGSNNISVARIGVNYKF